MCACVCTETHFVISCARVYIYNDDDPPEQIPVRVSRPSIVKCMTVAVRTFRILCAGTAAQMRRAAVRPSRAVRGAMVTFQEAHAPEAATYSKTVQPASASVSPAPTAVPVMKPTMNLYNNMTESQLMSPQTEHAMFIISQAEDAGT